MKDKLLGEIQFTQMIKTLLCKSTVWEHAMEIKNIYFILLGIKAFNECIIKAKKKVYTTLEIPLLSQAINIRGTIPSCDSTCFLFGLQPSYKSRCCDYTTCCRRTGLRSRRGGSVGVWSWLWGGGLALCDTLKQINKTETF